MIRYVKVAERHGEGCYRPLTRREPVYRVGQIIEASCPLVEEHRPPKRDCRCGIYCATAHSMAWVPYYHPRSPTSALLLVQPVGRALTDGRVLRAEKVLVLGEIEDVRTLLVPRLRNLDWPNAVRLLEAFANPYRVDRVHSIWRALGRRISRKRCEAFWRAYRVEPPETGCPFCRRRGGKR